MKKKEAKIKALEYFINSNYSYADLNNDFFNYSESEFNKIQNELDNIFGLMENKLKKLKNE